MTRMAAKIKLRRSPAMTAPRLRGAFQTLANFIRARNHQTESYQIAPNLLPTMSSNVGLTTPRGSGTSGYVQRNLSQLKPRDNFAPYPKDYDSMKHRQRKPDKDILNHDRLREIEVKVFDLRDKLEDEGYDVSLSFLLPLYSTLGTGC